MHDRYRTMKSRRTALFLLSLGISIDVALSQGTDLGGGVVTRTNVEKYADLALDVRDIDEILSTGQDATAAMEIYVKGGNIDAENVGEKPLTLQATSVDLASSLNNGDASPNYLYHLYGLTDRATDKATLETQARYADNYAKTAISSGNSYAAEALLVLNMWMYGTHILYKGVETCQRLSSVDNPGALTLGGGGMDEFIALWIGSETEGGDDDGTSLYSLTQQAGEMFGTLAPDEALANVALKQLYQEGAGVLSFADACTRGAEDQAVPQLWSVVQRMTSQMTVPLIQNLIDALMTEDAEKVKVYALALVPQVAQCRQSVYKRLKEELLGQTINFNRKQDAIEDLQSVYDCFGLKCSDIGTYKVDQLPACQEIPDNYPLAEYSPSTPVNSHAKIDLDILQMKILTSLESYFFAKSLYTFGRNSAIPPESDGDPYKVRTLKKFATTAARESANPFYTEFVEYHDDTNYADTAIADALDGRGKWGSASSESRTEVVAKTAAYRIMYMFALAEMGDAVADCESKKPLDNVGGSHSWDEVVAFLIGSLEGPTEGGSPDTDDGQLLWNLANKRAFQFQTENAMGFSKINSELEHLLYAGRGQLDGFDCVGLKKTVNRIQHLILIPIIQSTLRYAVENEALDEYSTSKNLAEGETFALGVLPIIKKYDEAAAQVIAENMIVNAGVKPVRDGAQVVADAFYEALDEFGVSCSFVGATSQVDACSREGGYSASVRLAQTAAYVICTISLLAGMLL